MAIFHLSQKIGTKEKHSGKAKFEYITRTGQYKNNDIIFSESGNMPEWAKDTPKQYWIEQDKYERADGRLFREFEFSLPRELDLDAQLKLVKQFTEYITTTPDGKLPYQLAIHKDQKNNNPHCHLVVSERAMDGIDRSPEVFFKRANKKQPEKGGAVKTRHLKSKEKLIEIRATLADMINASLKEAGITQTVDHRSLKEQGIDRLPTVHIGPTVLAIEERGIQTKIGDNFYDRRAEIERGESETFTARSKGRNDANTIPRIATIRDREAGENIRANSRINEDISGRHKKADRVESVTADSSTKHSERDHERNSRSSRVVEETLEYIFQHHSSDSSSNSSSICLGHSYSILALAQESLDARRNADQNNRPSREEVESALTRANNIGQGREKMENTNNRGGARRDRTAEAVKHQIEAMNCSLYEVGIRDPEKGMILKEYTPDQLIKAVNYLKRMNFLGNDIYVRPAKTDTANTLILLDDIEAVEDITDEGFSIACVTETSPKNFQCWLKMPEKLEPEATAEIARSLAKKFNGDPNSAEARHFGRLAGFTNRKEKHLNIYKGFPFVLCHDHTGVTLNNNLASELKFEAKKAISEREEQARKEKEEQESRLQKKERLTAILDYSENAYFAVTAGFKLFYKQWLEKQNHRQVDYSKGDYAVACRLLSNCRNAKEEVANAILEASPNLDNRKTTHALDYANRTAEAAFRNEAVQKARKEHLEKIKAREREEAEKRRQEALEAKKYEYHGRGR